ncbi:RNA methyltransferase [Tropicimonas sp. IMCC34043]|uniref:RNA methyltransferase n=1 Tax=Tropicimonas sp. IMCC34043 TaxID=2248760 RepID=UPI000E22CB35|nr:RNA methyltransferase [Tropicimonas sp. IMCC34043]
MPDPVFILVRPQMGENIGGAARAMWNFGLNRMRMVDPRDGWPNPRAAALASGAGRVLDHAGIFATTAEAIADCTHVYATTARGRGLSKRVLTPEAAMAEARAATAAGGRVGIMFGPERAGLENEDIARAEAIITVPVNPEFFSLNLAQCVLLTAYEWRRQAVDLPEGDEIERAPAIEVERLADHFETRLDQAGFFFPPTKAPGMKVTVRNMLSRLALSPSDVQIFHGMLRQLTRRKLAPNGTDDGEG